MATTDYDFTLTRNQIIERAFEIVGVKRRGQALGGEYVQEGVLALNALVKSWQGKNVFLWTLKSISQTLADGVDSYALTLDPPVIAIDSAFLVMGANDEEQLEVLSWREYQSIPDKASPGSPNTVALNGQSPSTLYVYPVPTGTQTLRLLAISKLKDWDSANADFPVRWERALIYNLAADLADGYGVPINERNMLSQKAFRLFVEARQGDREEVTGSFVEGSYPVKETQIMTTTLATIVTPLLAGLVDATGQALSGGKVYAFAAGTTTPKTTWTDITKNTAAAHPIILDSSGKAQIYADGSYKFRIDTASDVTIATWDNLPFRSIDSSVTSWTPSYGAQAGTWAATTRVARYQRTGDTCFAQLYASGTPSTTPTYLTVTLPFDAVGSGFERYCQGLVNIGGVYDVCHLLIPGTGTTAQIYRRDLNAWAASATTVIINFMYEI